MPRKKTDKLFFEAQVNKTGREWEVTIIGPKTPEHLLTVEGREYILSDNGRLYAVDAIEQSAGMWEGVKVYDDHQTEEEFQRRSGMRSPKNEWLGSLVSPRFVRDNGLPQLRAIFKVVEDGLAKKLKNAWDAGVLNTIGLSLNAFTEAGREVMSEGRAMQTVEGFSKILSVDLVGNPATAGGFVRLIAAEQEMKVMSDETNEDVPRMVDQDILSELVSKAVADAFAAKAEEAEDIEALADDEVIAAKAEKDTAVAEGKLQRMAAQAEKLQQEAAIARTSMRVDKLLAQAGLKKEFADVVEFNFEGKVATEEEIAKFIRMQKRAQAAYDPTGKVRTPGGSGVSVGMGQEDRFSAAIGHLLMGESVYRKLENNEDETVKERLLEDSGYQAWKNHGKEKTGYYRMSQLLYDYFDGNPLEGRVMEAASTATLTTAVKNTVNIMLANAYSQRELWWEPIVTTHEVDTIDDATLARVYGAATLSTVAEGGAYTELQLADEEETASFVKRGNYIGVTMELLMRDKISEVQRIPVKLANAWYNTQADLVSNVFTVNSAAGPALSDSGALFNATATTSGGGHKNLLTTALSHAAFAAARLEMRKQTDDTLGTGRKLAISPRYLLVPVDLEQTAWEIRNSELFPGADFDAAGGGAQTSNFLRNMFDIIVVPPWTDATNWALVGDPALYPAIHLIYPRGQRVPQIFSADNESTGAMFTNDELRFKVRLMTYRFSATYDCAPVSDFRPLHKSNVAG